MDAEAGVGALGHFDGGAGDAGRAAVLEAFDPIGVFSDEGDAGFHEEFFEEGVADLDGWSAVGGVLVEVRRWRRWRRGVRRGRCRRRRA